MEEKVWITQAPGLGAVEKTSTYERGTYYFFDAQNWRKVPKEFHLDYSKLENRPILPQSYVPIQPVWHTDHDGYTGYNCNDFYNNDDDDVNVYEDGQMISYHRLQNDGGYFDDNDGTVFIFNYRFSTNPPLPYADCNLADIFNINADIDADDYCRNYNDCYNQDCNGFGSSSIVTSTAGSHILRFFIYL